MRGAARISLALALTLTGVAEAQTVRPIVIGEAPVPGVAAAPNAPRKIDLFIDYLFLCCRLTGGNNVPVSGPVMWGYPQ